MQPTIAAAVADAFRNHFGGKPAAVAFAPGRVNIIGEHTDYNDGFVLPAAIDLATAIAFVPRDDGRVRLYSDMVSEEVEFDFDPTIRDQLPFWARYAWGVGMSLAERAVTASGFNGYAKTTVPQGGGLSSSASFELAVSLACLGRRWETLDKLDLARICRRAENKYVGTQCGIMDQYSILFGAPGHAVMLDCRSLESRLIPFPASAALVVSDTGVRHVLGESGYHKRQEECAEAASKMSAAVAGVKNLRDVSMNMLDEKRRLLGDAVYRRARHVVTENARVHDAAAAMSAGDVRRLGGLMTQSHLSLRDDFEVSCRELDAMVECAGGLPGHFGTRMTGGGFGGCAIVLAEAARSAEIARSIQEGFPKRFGRVCPIFATRAAQGARAAE